MNRVILSGRLTKDPEIHYGKGNNDLMVARYTMAVRKKGKKDEEPTADFISCTAFGKMAEVAEKYLQKGMKLAITGKIQTGNYTNQEGKKVYTTDVIVKEQEFFFGKEAS